MVVASGQHLYQTIEQFDRTIVLPRELATGSIHDNLLCYCPLMSILSEVLRNSSNLATYIVTVSNINSKKEYENNINTNDNKID